MSALHLRTPTPLRAMARWSVVCVAHFALARLGVALAFHGQDASLVWPAHGFALAMLLLLGPRVWSAIGVATLASALYSGAPLHSALVISAGNVVGPLVGALLLRRTDFRPALVRVRDVALLTGTGALSAAVTASIAIPTLVLRGAYAIEQAPLYWAVWWAGDFTGLLALSPFLLVWSRAPAWAAQRGRVAEFAASLVLAVTAWLLATEGLPLVRSEYPLLYVIFPIAIWMAIRFEQHGAVTLALVVSGAAIWETLYAMGPFASLSPQQTLMYLQAFVAVIAGSSLLLAASTAERRELERQQRVALERERAAREEAQRAVAAREKAVAVVSHEIRNPLGTVLLNATSLLETIEEEDLDRRFAVRSIVISADQINHVIRDLTDLTLLESSQAAMELEGCSPAALIGDTRDMLGALAEERGLELQVRSEPELPPVLAHHQRVLQVLGNLVGNAIKASPAGGQVRIEGWREGEWVWFAVEDSGPGIPESRVEQLMQPFWGVPYSHRSKTGLGIPIARAIVAAHGGSFRIRNHPQEGCRIEFSLRVSPAGGAADRGHTGAALAEAG